MPTPELTPLDDRLTVAGSEAVSADHRWLFYFEDEDQAWHVCRRTWRGRPATWMYFVALTLDDARARVEAGDVDAYLNQQDAAPPLAALPLAEAA